MQSWMSPAKAEVNHELNNHGTNHIMFCVFYVAERALGEKECPVTLLNTGHKLKLVSLSGQKRHRYIKIVHVS